MFTTKNPKSLLSIVIIAVVFIWQILLHLPGNILSWDTFGAYLYLPATFIYHDPQISDLSWVNEIIDQYHNTPYLYQGYATETGNWMIKYPAGFSVIFSPFFFVGHLFAGWLGYPQDGFSLPYQYSILIGNCFYVVISWFVIRKVLVQFFQDVIVALLLLVLFFGTNYYFIVVNMPAMPHGYLFIFYSLILWYTMKWHKSPTIKNSIFLGLSLGLATLARASEIIAVLIPLLWNVSNKETLKHKWIFIKSNQKALYNTMITFVLCGLPQLVYWKITTGSLFVDSYNNPGEGFDFLFPHVLDFLFSYRKGWLLYTPLMLLGLIGFIHLYRKKKQLFYPLFVFTLINIYLLSSWTCWWYAESFGQRSIVESYAVLLIPMGFLFTEVLKRTSYKSILFLLVLALFSFLNLFQSWQVDHGLIDLSRMTKAAYWDNFLSTSESNYYKSDLLLDHSIDPEEYVSKTDIFISRKVFEQNFDNVAKNNRERYSSFGYNGTHSVFADSEEIYTEDISIPYYKVTEVQQAIINVSARIYFKGKLEEVKPSLVCKIRHKGREYMGQVVNIENDYPDLAEENWYKIEKTFYAPTIRDYSKDDLQIFGWIRGKGEMWLDNVEVVVFERR